MADLVITATSVVPGANANLVSGVAGETLTAGMAVYKKAADGLYYKAKKNGTAAEAVVAGVVVNGGSVNQAVQIQTGGQITIGAALTAGETYIVSATYGGIAPVADVSTHSLSYIGYAISTTVMQLQINPTGITHG